MFMKFNSCELSFFFECNCICDLIQVFINVTLFLEGGWRFGGAKMRFAPHFFDWGGATAPPCPPPPPPLPAPMNGPPYTFFIVKPCVFKSTSTVCNKSLKNVMHTS